MQRCRNSKNSCEKLLGAKRPIAFSKGLQHVTYVAELRARLQSQQETCEQGPDGLQKVGAPVKKAQVTVTSRK